MDETIYDTVLAVNDTICLSMNLNAEHRLLMVILLSGFIQEKPVFLSKGLIRVCLRHFLFIGSDQGAIIIIVRM
jgi:hypothetical protein